MSSAKVLLPLFVCIVTAALLAACGGDGASPSRGSQSLTDPSDVPTTTPWATPPPVVYVEGGPVVPSNGGAEGSYTVEPNDTAYAIALKFGITVEELAAANDMTVAEVADLSVGQKLKIPQRATEQQPVTTTTPQTSEPAATSTPAPVTGEEGTYTVQDGDIPVTIAEQFGITVEALLAANDDIDPTNLRIGQVLIIPTPTPEP
jgi:LysM repeat protein